MLGHLPLCYLVISEFVPHAIKNQTCLLKADELEQVHVVVETKVETLFSRYHEEPEFLHVVYLYTVLDARHSLVFFRSYRIGCGSDGAWVVAGILVNDTYCFMHGVLLAHRPLGLL